MLWIVLAVVVLLALFVALAYNGLIAKRNRSQNAWAQVDVQLRRRYDLIPNLVESVKGYAAARARDVRGGDRRRARGRSRREGPAEQAAAEARAERRARPADRRRGGLPGAARDGELPAAAGRARPRRRTRSRSRGRSTTTPSSPTTTPSSRSRRTSSPGSSTSSRASTSSSRPATPRASRSRWSSDGAGARRARARRSCSSSPPLQPRRSRSRCPTPSRTCASRATARSTCARSSRSTTSAPFSGAYRDIPLRDGERIDRRLGRRGRAALPARRLDRARHAGAAPRSSAPAGVDGNTRIVWRYSAVERAAHVHRSATASPGSPSPTTTSSTSTSRSGATTWKIGLGRLQATMAAPEPVTADATRASTATPSTSRATRAFDDGFAQLRALDVPPEQFVEMRLLFPRSMLTSTRRREGRRRATPARGSSPRSAPTPPSTSAAGRKIDDAIDHLVPHAALPAAARRSLPGARRSSAPSGSSLARAPRRRLRPRVRAGAAVRRPARRWSGRCCASRTRAGRPRVHRDAVRPHPPRPLKAEPITTEKWSWGALGKRPQPDLLLRARAPTGGATRSRPAVDEDLDRALADGAASSSPTSSDKIKEQRESNAKTLRARGRTRSPRSSSKRRWYDDRARAPIVLAAIAMTLLAARAPPRSAPSASTRASCAGARSCRSRSASPRR